MYQNISWLPITENSDQVSSRVKRIYYLRSGKCGSRGVQGVDSGTRWCHKSPGLFLLNAFKSWASPGSSAVAPAPGSQMAQQFIHFPDATATRRKRTLCPSWSARKTSSRSAPHSSRMFSQFSLVSVAWHAHDVPGAGRERRGLTSSGCLQGAWWDWD